jgi:hypothetical protein
VDMATGDRDDALDPLELGILPLELLTAGK